MGEAAEIMAETGWMPGSDPEWNPKPRRRPNGSAPIGVRLTGDKLERAIAAQMAREDAQRLRTLGRCSAPAETPHEAARTRALEDERERAKRLNDTAPYYLEGTHGAWQAVLGRDEHTVRAGRTAGRMVDPHKGRNHAAEAVLAAPLAAAAVQMGKRPNGSAPNGWLAAKEQRFETTLANVKAKFAPKGRSK